MNKKPQPDIRLFQSHGKRHDPFSKFDYMGVLPTLKALEAFLRTCDMARDASVKLPQKFLDSEMRCFWAIQNNEYVKTDYPWEDTITDCWWTTPETWWQDFLKQKELWEGNQ